MKDIKYFEQKVERLEKVITMRECQLRCACSGLETVACGPDAYDVINEAEKTLAAVDAIYDLHQGEKIEDGFLGQPHKRG